MVQLCIPVTTRILYVSLDNSTNVSCSFQHCATLSEHLLDNGTLPVVSNVQYYFLPGEHHVPANMLLQDLCNFSIIGTVKESPPPVVLVGCLQSYIINVINSYNVTIANVMFRQCDQMQFSKHGNLLINLCYSCTIDNVIFINLGLKGVNLIGNSYLTKIMIKFRVSKQNFLVFCQGITLYYWDKPAYEDHKHLLVMNQLIVSGKTNGSKCYNSDPVGIYIAVSMIENSLIIINNSLFHGLHHTAIMIRNQCFGNNTVIVENCMFEDNTRNDISENFLVTVRPLIDIVLSHSYKTVLFKQCSFKRNYNDHHLVSILTNASWACYGKMKHCVGPFTNITFMRCQFSKNKGELMNIKGTSCKANLLITGPSYFDRSAMQVRRNNNLMAILYMIVQLIGPITISTNHARSIMHFESCEIIFYGNIMIESSSCDQVITLRFTSIEVREYANITLLKNKHLNKLIETEHENDYKVYPLCIFQFVTLQNITNVALTHYSINIIDNLYYVAYLPGNEGEKKNCSFPLYHFTPHCQWLPNTVFHDYSPKVVYQQIIKIRGQDLTYHKMCICSQNGSYDCNIDTLGPVYSGQMLQVELCTPCNDQPSVLYAEVSRGHLPHSICKVSSHGESHLIYNYSSPTNFAIVSEATDVCELLLTISSSSLHISEAFYVQLLSCPIGFTLQNGMCDCDPVFSTYTVECYIDDSAIKRFANTWITAQSETNNTKYLVSECPMDYCLPYSSKLNLLYPDLQCQFNRSGILCSQCQYHLSMVFGSSRCMECTNLSIILISVIVIIAGVVLVVLLYILNLTVTNGTISGIIFYANIVSINDSVFLVNDNVFKPLRVFISFANLDLGIETCFYDGMDTYAKVWFQLFFPVYLLVIAISVIIASRYSSKILRLTYSRSLPVLATLFLLFYTGILRVVLTVLFSFSSITLPTR